MAELVCLKELYLENNRFMELPQSVTNLLMLQVGVPEKGRNGQLVSTDRSRINGRVGETQISEFWPIGIDTVGHSSDSIGGSRPEHKEHR